MGSTISAATISPTVLPVASGPGLGLVSVPAIFTPNPSNDNQIGGGSTDNNVIIPLKRFDFNDYIDIVFAADPSTGTTEYKVTEFVDNNTGVGWSAYTMQLGDGTGANFVPFSSGALTFDAPNYDTPPSASGPLTAIVTNPYELSFSGGVQSTGAQQYSFRLDIPNDFPSRDNRFTLRQIPTPVPEPAALAMIAMTLMGFVASRRRS